MSEKQTIFFTINCVENLESPNQCYLPQNSNAAAPKNTFFTILFAPPGFSRLP
jgi:hypothetical protein